MKASRTRFRNSFLEDFRELRFRIVQVIDINALDAEIFQAAPKLVFQKFWRHAMTAGGDILRAEDSGLDVFAEKIFIGVGGMESSGVR